MTDGAVTGGAVTGGAVTGGAVTNDAMTGNAETEEAAMTDDAMTQAAAAAWPGPIFAITVFTDDLPGTKDFYARVFGLAAQWEDDDSAVFAFPNVVINVLVATAAPELIAPVPVASSSAGARVLFTINVDNTDATCSRLAAVGVELLNGPIDRPWGVRTATFTDPGGHVWEIASAI
jgi:lactoylglutathione lyase